MGSPTNRQIAGQDVIVVADKFYIVTLKSDSRIVVYIQEIATPQVTITVRVSGPETAGIHRHSDRGIFRVCRIKFKRAVYVLEVSPDVGNHHVPCRKFSGCMPGLEYPFCHRLIPERLECCPSFPSLGPHVISLRHVALGFLVKEALIGHWCVTIKKRRLPCPMILSLVHSTTSRKSK